MRRVVNVGLIGCGGRVRHVASTIPGIGKSIVVRALSDPDPDSLRIAKEKLNPDAKAYRDYKQLVSDPELDWVMVGSWNCFHKEQVVAALKAGKHVFTEKPIATTFEDCLAMYRAHRKSGLMCMVGFTLRYSPHYRKVKEIVSSGKLGQIVSMEFNETLHFDHGGYFLSDWRRFEKNGGSYILEKCCHDMDLANWILDSVPARVASFAGNNIFIPRNKKLMERIGDPDGGAIPFSSWAPDRTVNPFTCKKTIIDNQVIILEYRNGVRATFHTNACTSNGFQERRMYICGVEGTLRADVITGEIEYRRVGYKERRFSPKTGASGAHGDGDSILGKELRAAMTRGVVPPTGLKDGLKSAIVCFGIDKATETGQVYDLAPLWRRAHLT